MVTVVVNAQGQEAKSLIHPWEQFVHSFRTQVASLHHNVSAALQETFGESWQPTDEPVWLLGRRYEAKAPCRADADADADDAAGAGPEPPASGPCGTPEDFASAWAQITRMTYRKGFAPMYRCVRSSGKGSSDEHRRFIRLTSDAGWGCMIRVGQMLLATVLKRHFGCDAGVRGGGEAVRSSTGLPGASGRGVEDVDVSSLERQFLDDPSPERSPFSIFGFIRTAHGREVTVPPGEEGQPAARAGRSGGRQLTQKLPGDWFGPTTISETVAALIEQRPELDSSLAVYIDADGVLYEDEVRALAYGEQLLIPSLPPSPQLGYSVGGKAIGRISGTSGSVGSAGGAYGGAGAGDAGWEVVSTASVSSASGWSPHQSPLLCTVRADAQPQELSPQLTGLDSGDDFEEAQCADVLQVSSFHELQPNLELVELCGLQLPPAEMDAAAGEPSSPTGDGASSSSAAPPPRWRKAVLLLFPLQLGLDKYINEARVSSVLRYFELPCSLGAMGGRPRMAHFFVGRQERGLLYVDPHVVQAAVTGAADGEDAVAADGAGPATVSEAFRNAPKVQVIPVEHIDSSISFAFYCRSQEELTELMAGLRRIESVEANAPIRIERTRPAALRNPQAAGHSFLEDDGVEDVFSEDDLAEAEPSPPSTGDSSPSGGGCEAGGGGGDSGWHAGVHSGPCDADDSQADTAPSAAGERRALCVGPAWADISAPWAEVEASAGVSVYEAQHP